MPIIARGAEAVITHADGKVVKHRVSKGYRHPTIDKQLRSFRTRREAKVLEKLQHANIPAPRLLKLQDDEGIIEMTYLKGKKLRDVLHERHTHYAAGIGKLIAHLHAQHIIHSDLTTSNMLVVDGELHIIDFGLSFFSEKPEDKATDLKLLHRALESKHHEIAGACYELALKAYAETYPGAEAVLARLEDVQLRGRNKRKSTKE